jgi:tetratricopeptide (TPR) repeat protein
MGRFARLLGIVLPLASVLGGCGGTSKADADAQAAYRHSFEAINAGDWLKAEQYLIQAKAAFPDDPYVLLNLGVVAQRLGRFDEARGYYQQVIDKGSDVIPRQVSDPAEAGKSLADLARDDLATLPN